MKTNLDKLYLKKSDIVIPKEKWNKLLEVLENHRDKIEELKMSISLIPRLEKIENRIKHLENKEELA